MKHKWNLLGVALAVGGLWWGLSLAHGQTGGYGTIVVKVPKGAIISIGDQKMTQTGMSRTFYSGDLQPGFNYQYEFKVSWLEGGKEKSSAKWVDVFPGKTVTVDLTPATSGKKEVIKKADVPKNPDEPKIKIKAGNPKERHFRFTYSGKVMDLKPGQEANVWLPMPPDTVFQDVEVVKQDLPTPGKKGQEKLYGNQMLYFQGKANEKGEIPFSVVYKVERKEVLTGDGKGTLSFAPVKEDKGLLTPFLEPDKLVPTSGQPLEDIKTKLIKDRKLPGDQVKAAKELYDVVNGHMKYDKPKGKPWGRGDAVWACENGYGNCTDFHSLFISMARGSKIPSKFEMGFSVPTKHGKGDIGGYHCWAWFLPEGKGWVPVDISEANRFPEMKDYYFGNLTEDRVQFSTGRDINLVPQQKGEALNFFIYPYVEVEGVPYPPEKVARKFEYEDVK